MKRTWLIVTGLVLFLSLVLMLLLQHPPRRFDGRITLQPTHKIPYGTYVAYQMLQQHFPSAKMSVSKAAPGKWKLPVDDSSSQVLLIVMNFFNPTSEELNTLTVFAQKGNTVFISALQMNEKAQHFFRVAQKKVYSPYGISQNNETIHIADSFTVCLNPKVFAPPASFSYPGIAYDNHFVHYDSSFTYPLGYDEGKVENLLAIQTLKGSFILHAAPITFTNFFLLYGDNHLYFDKLMSLIPDESRYIFWDNYFANRKPPSDKEDNSVLYVLLKYENFRWAFWLSVAAFALFLFTEMKRRQRMLPLYAQPANESLAFVKTIGRLYYERGDHKNLADKLSVYFLDFIRTKYKISTTEINPDFAKALSQKSTVPLPEITAITDLLMEVKISDHITSQLLMDYYRRLEHFYGKV